MHAGANSWNSRKETWSTLVAYKEIMKAVFVRYRIGLPYLPPPFFLKCQPGLLTPNTASLLIQKHITTCQATSNY